jgi:hypothetical protein
MFPADKVFIGNILDVKRKMKNYVCCMTFLVLFQMFERIQFLLKKENWVGRRTNVWQLTRIADMKVRISSIKAVLFQADDPWLNLEGAVVLLSYRKKSSSESCLLRIIAWV